MSKIGRKPINISGVKVEVKGQEIHFKGPKGFGLYLLPKPLIVRLEDNTLTVVVNPQANLSPKELQDTKRVWGLHHALLENSIKGACKEFEKQLKIIGLGYKAALTQDPVHKILDQGKAKQERIQVIGEANTGNGLLLTLGYSHRIYFTLDKGVSVEVDKSGQNLTVKSCNAVLAGDVASKIRGLRPPEPYKGTGIRGATEIVRRKAGKTKSG